MRDIVMFLAMAAMVPMAFANGLVAFLLWGYTTVLTPANYVYGFMQGVRYNFIFAIIALAWLFLSGRKKDQEKTNLTLTYWLLVAFFIHANLSTLFALTPNIALMSRYENLVKGFSFILAIPFFVKDRISIHAMLIVIALGLGFHGVVEGLKFLASGGGHRVAGLGGSLTDNNLLALGMVMALPILLYFYNTFENKYAKYIALSSFLLTVLTVIASNSRGGFLALAVLAVWYIVATRRKFVAFAAIAVSIFLISLLAQDSWFDRISTIQTASDDQSFMNRVAAWRVSLAIGLSNPIFGGGFSGVQIPWIWDTYKFMPSIFDVDMTLFGPKASHSIYFQVLSDLGFVGLFFFLSLLASVYFNRKIIRNKIKKHNRADLIWAIDLADAIFLSILAYMAGGAGVSLTYYEIIYMLIVLMSVLHTIVDKQLKTI